MPESPLQSIQDRCHAGFVAFGDPNDEQAPRLVEGFGAYESEYAALRKGAGVFDLPHAGVVELSGSERVEFLQRFASQDVKALAPGGSARSLLLTAQGRIRADMRILADEDRHILVTDALVAGQVAQGLEQYLFSEDVTVTDRTGEGWSIGVFGPAAGDALAELGATDAGGLAPGGHTTAELAGARVHVHHDSLTGQTGLVVRVPRDRAAGVYEALLERARADGWDPDAETVSGKTRLRPVGWLAVNTARIEAGRPMFRVDFGPDSLPHETGLLDEAVSLTKGCYLGQEIVARMQSLGHPSKKLVGLKLDTDDLPGAGEPIMDSDTQDVIGAVTSSTLSTMLGNVGIALAMIKWGKHTAGTVVRVPGEGRLVQATVQDGLRFVTL